MVIPPFLNPGDTVAIVATARKVSPAEMQHAISLLESWGLIVHIPDLLYSAANQFAGEDAIRTEVLQQALSNPNIKAVFCARGGYGTVRIIDSINFSAFVKNPKWVIGYSDITVLHSHIHTHCNVATLHAPMPINMLPEKADAESLNQLRDNLIGKAPEKVVVTGHSLNRKGSSKAPLVGGNLSVLFSTLGSASDIDTDGKILFLEDLDEYLYHIDRMMMNLKRNGKLAKLAGLVVGDMSDMKDNAIPFGLTAYQIIASHVQDVNYPVLFGYPAGHEKRNLPLMFGVEYVLEVNEQDASLSCAL